jgi:hypothetical protein
MYNHYVHSFSNTSLNCQLVILNSINCIIIPPLHRREGILFYLCSSVQNIFRHIFLSNYRWQKSDIWSQASYWYAILWEAFLDTSDSYFMFVDLVGFYTHWTYMWGYHKWALAHSSSCFALFIRMHVLTVKMM